MADMLVLSDVYRLLDATCRKAGSQSAFAAQHGMTVQFVSAVLNARKAPSPRLLAALGLREVVRFMPIQQASTQTVETECAAFVAGATRSVGTEGTALLLSNGATQRSSL